MILNEKVEEFFNNKELEGLKGVTTGCPAYNNVGDSVSSPYPAAFSNILDFNIKDDTTNKNQASISGIVDYTNSQFVIKKIDVDSDVLDSERVSVVKRLLNSIIVNLEQEQISISTVYWRVNKDCTDFLKAATDMGFTIQDTNAYSFELVYFLSGFPVRQGYNSSKVLNAVRRMSLNTGEF